MENLATTAYALGLDIAKDSIAVCLTEIFDNKSHRIKASCTITNNLKGFDTLLNWLQKHCKHPVQIHCFLEATGVYYETCAYFLFHKDFQVYVLLPQKVKHFIRSLGVQTKNDTIDAKCLALMIFNPVLRPWKPISSSVYQIRQVNRQLQAIIKQKTQLSNQLHALNYSQFQNPVLLELMQNQLKNIEQQMIALQQELKNLVNQDKELAEKVNRIAQIKGVGIFTIITLLAETNGFVFFENAKQLCSYAGYDIVENQSGKKSGRTRISKHGNHQIRKVLHFPALSVVRYEIEPFKTLFDRLYQKNQIKMKAYVAVQRKLLTIIFTLWKNGQEFNPKHKKVEKPTASLHEIIP